jgi:hypothetical protein
MKKILAAAFILAPCLLFAGPDPRGILELEGYGTSDAAGIKSTRTRGDFTIKETLISGDNLFFLNGYGYNGTSVPATPRAQITFSAGESWTTTNQGADIHFSITPNGSTAMSDVLKISTSGFTVPTNLRVRTNQVNDPQPVLSMIYSTGVYTPTGTLQLISSTGAITLTGLPTIATSPFLSGQEIVLISTAANITLTNQSVTAGTCLQLDANTLVISTFTPARFRLINGIWFKEN